MFLTVLALLPLFIRLLTRVLLLTTHLALHSLPALDFNTGPYLQQLDLDALLEPDHLSVQLVELLTRLLLKAVVIGGGDRSHRFVLKD